MSQHGVGVVESTERAEWRRGGRTAISAMLGYGAGPIAFVGTASVFVKPMIAATGWSTTEVMIAPIVNIVMTIVGPLVGWFVDRHGTRRTLAIGLIPWVLLLIVLAVAPFTRWSFYGLAAIIGLFGSFAYTIPYNRAVGLWFDKSAGKAFGLVGAGAALAPFVLVPVVAWTVYTYGWQRGYLVLAAASLLVAIPAGLVGVQGNGPARRVRPSGPTRPAATVAVGSAVPTAQGDADSSAVLRTGRFWLLNLSILLVWIASGAFLTSIQPLLLDGGLAVALATTVTSVYSIGVLAGRFVAGTLLDLFPRYRVAPAILLVSALGALALTSVQILPFAVVIIATLLVSFSQGAEGDFIAFFIVKEYGRAHFGRLFGYVTLVAGLGGAGGMYIFGFTRDLTGGYTLAALVGAACLAAGALLLVVVGVLGRKERSAPHDRDVPAAVSASDHG